MHRPLLALLIAVAGCGSNGSPADLATPPDLTTVDLAAVDLVPTDLADSPGPPDLFGVDLAGYPAAHAPFPQLARHQGGVISHVRLVTVTYDDFPYRAVVEEWGDFVFGSKWLQAVGAEYGVVGGSQIGRVHLPGSAPAEVQTGDLLDKLDVLMDAGMAPAPMDGYDDQVYYAIHLPETTTLTDGNGKGCQDYYGFHSTSIHGGIIFPFAIIMDCGGGVPDLTSTAAHELIETATDGYQNPHEGYYLDAAFPSHYYAEPFGEVADLCNDENYVYEKGHAMQPSWSNAAAAAGLAPCVPNNGWPFYGMDVVPATAPTVAPGTMVTFTITGWSMSPRNDWSIGVAASMGSALTNMQLHPTLSANKINNGKSVTLTLTVPAGATSGKVGTVDVYSNEIATRLAPASFIVQ